jgi:tRNA pseudouridine38-40 synthase
MAPPPTDAPAGILLTVSYDGEAFAGFAPQPGQRTVHGALLDAARKLDPTIGVLRGASRTDAGVHAFGQLVALDPSGRIPPRGWVLGMNAHLDADVAVRRAQPVPRGFEPRASRRGKRYRYLVMRDPVRDPHLERIAWRIGGSLDLAAMRTEAASLLGTHDFRAFRSSSDERIETTRTITRVDLVEEAHADPRLLSIVVEGTAFLHNMIRIVVGTLVDVGCGRLAPGACARALATGARTDLGITAPAKGLALDEVFHDVSPEWGAAWP